MAKKISYPKGKMGQLVLQVALNRLEPAEFSPARDDNHYISVTSVLRIHTSAYCFIGQVENLLEGLTAPVTDYMCGVSLVPADELIQRLRVGTKLNFVHKMR